MALNISTGFGGKPYFPIAYIQAQTTSLAPSPRTLTVRRAQFHEFSRVDDWLDPANPDVCRIVAPGAVDALTPHRAQM